MKNNRPLGVGSVVLYTVAGGTPQPYMVQSTSMDFLTIKPVHLIALDKRGSIVVPASKCAEVRMVHHVTRPVLDLSGRQLHFVKRALTQLAEAARAGEHEAEEDELCAIHNALGAIKEYEQKRREVK